MKKYVILALALIWLVSLAPMNNAEAEQFSGGYGYQYATSARTIPKGAWQLMSHSRVALVDNGSGESYTNATLASTLTYGLFNNFEVEITSLLYQYVNFPRSAPAAYQTNVPDGGYIRWKWGNIKLMNKVYFGIQGSLRNTIGTYNNVYLEPYYPEGQMIQINYLFSWLQKPDFPDHGIQIHYNGGYVNFNDGPSLTENTDAIRIYSALVYPLSRKFTYVLEGHGTFFNSLKPTFTRIKSIENFYYATSTVIWNFSSSWKLFAGLDVLLYEEADKTAASIQPPSRPNYPSWRLNYKLVWRPGAAKWGGPRARKIRKNWDGRKQLPYGTGYYMDDRVRLYDWGGYAKEDIGYVDVELDRIRSDRKFAEEQLKKIKDKLTKESPAAMNESGKEQNKPEKKDKE